MILQCHYFLSSQCLSIKKELCFVLDFGCSNVIFSRGQGVGSKAKRLIKIQFNEESSYDGVFEQLVIFG